MRIRDILDIVRAIWSLLWVPSATLQVRLALVLNSALFYIIDALKMNDIKHLSVVYSSNNWCLDRIAICACPQNWYNVGKKNQKHLFAVDPPPPSQAYALRLIILVLPSFILKKLPIKIIANLSHTYSAYCPLLSGSLLCLLQEAGATLVSGDSANGKQQPPSLGL